MTHTVSALNQRLHARQLDQMFRVRHVFCVEGHGWDALTSRD